MLKFDSVIEVAEPSENDLRVIVRPNSTNLEKYRESDRFEILRIETHTLEDGESKRIVLMGRKVKADGERSEKVKVTQNLDGGFTVADLKFRGELGAEVSTDWAGHVTALLAVDEAGVSESVA